MNQLFYVILIVCGGSVFVFILVCINLCLVPSFAIILKTKREMVALLLLSYICLVTVYVRGLFLTLPWVGLQCFIVVFFYQTHGLLHEIGQYPQKL